MINKRYLIVYCGPKQALTRNHYCHLGVLRFVEFHWKWSQVRFGDLDDLARLSTEKNDVSRLDLCYRLGAVGCEDTESFYELSSLEIESVETQNGRYWILESKALAFVGKEATHIYLSPV